ncbi:MAG: methyltransferase domain-containing protein [Acidobacteria bacterium]|nr:methyltransferase domain-containing protein [Acidobacteriota bacterium]
MPATKPCAHSSPSAVRRQVADFYSRYPYPPPAIVTRYQRPAFALERLNLRLAAAGRPPLPPNLRIWAPGGGTTLPVQLALHFPSASILATDICARSLQIAAKIARSLQLTNIDFRHEDLLDSAYRGQFHLIDCAGVLNHVARPADGFRAIRRALHPSGVANLWVYNTRQRWLSDAWQSALALLGATQSATQTNDRWTLARHLVDWARLQPNWRRTREALGAIHPSIDPVNTADALIHPREISFTLAQLWSLLARSGLHFLAWREDHAWDPLNTPGLPAPLRARIATLPPLERFQLIEALAEEDAPYFDLFAVRANPPHSPAPVLPETWRPAFNPSIEFINLRGARAVSSHHMPVLRRTEDSWAAYQNGDAREKSGLWLPLTPPQARLLEQADGTRTVPELLREPSSEPRRALAAFLHRAASSPVALLA